MHPLCEKPAHELSRLLMAREISSEELVAAHLDHIEAADGAIHAFVEVLRSEAIASAREADAERRRGDVRGPLHGLPISVKESLDFAGKASTLGTTKRRAILAEKDAGIVACMRAAGAVILGRTNVSQLLMFHESRNPLFGTTASPWSLDHTPGGSSGGEAAAIAAGMAPLGVGTDIGGSIRVPAHFAGIAGIKPTLDRWTNNGSNTAIVGQEVIRSQLGPMARTARDLALAMSAIDPHAMSAIDGRVPPLPVPDVTHVEVKGLRIAAYVDDGLVPPSAAIARAMREASSALARRGADVIEAAPPGLSAIVYDYFGAMSADGGATALSWIAGDAIDGTLAPMRALARVPSPIRRAAAHGARLAGEPKLAAFLEAVGEKTVAALWALTTRQRRARAGILAWMDAERIDLVLGPAHATPALPHGLSRDFLIAASPSIVWNVAQLPAGVVPVTRVRADETLRKAPRDRLEKRAAEVDRQSLGLPVGVQLVARPWREDLVLAAMIAVEDEASRAPDFPRTPVAPRPNARS